MASKVQVARLAVKAVAGDASEILGNINTTNFRILFTTIVLAGGTAARYLLSGCHMEGTQCVANWEPSQYWLGFILLMAGIDAAQHFGKRKTEFTPEQQAQGKAILANLPTDDEETTEEALPSPRQILNG